MLAFGKKLKKPELRRIILFVYTNKYSDKKYLYCFTFDKGMDFV